MASFSNYSIMLWFQELATYFKTTGVENSF